MSAKLEDIRDALTPLKTKIVNHQAYQVIASIEQLRIFMRYHVYAVWDFMSLLKALQINLTCTKIPWFPVGSGSIRALINQIVAGEESDIDANGEQKSHFEMYLDAMEQCGAETTEINYFIAALQSGASLNEAFEAAGTPPEIRSFVNFTFSLIEEGKTFKQAAAFTFGREDLIPGMFHSIVTDLNEKFPGEIALFKYYLDRHIEIDGDEHGHLALEMTAELCAGNPEYWKEAADCSRKALEQRILLWDGIKREIEAQGQHGSIADNAQNA